MTPWLIEEFEKNTWVPYWLKSHSGILLPTILIGVYFLIPICFGARLPSGSFIYYLVCVCTALLIPCAFNRDLTKSLPKHLPVLLVILLFAGFWSYHWGVREAKRQKWFLVPEKTTDMVVFRIYDDNCITSKFDRPTKTTTPHLTIQPLGDADPKEAAVLRYEPVGPLIPWKKD